MPGWAEQILRRQRVVTKALGAEERVIVDRHDGGHVWHGRVAGKVLAKELRP